MTQFPDRPYFLVHFRFIVRLILKKYRCTDASWTAPARLMRDLSQMDNCTLLKYGYQCGLPIDTHECLDFYLSLFHSNHFNWFVCFYCELPQCLLQLDKDVWLKRGQQNERGFFFLSRSLSRRKSTKVPFFLFFSLPSFSSIFFLLYLSP